MWLLAAKPDVAQRAQVPVLREYGEAGAAKSALEGLLRKTVSLYEEARGRFDHRQPPAVWRDNTDGSQTKQETMLAMIITAGCG